MDEKLEWEDIAANTCRLKVIGGWIVEFGSSNGQSCAFVPDKGHKWKITEEPK